MGENVEKYLICEIKSVREDESSEDQIINDSFGHSSLIIAHT